MRDDGGPITARHALVRALVGYVEIYLLLGVRRCWPSLISPRAKRLGDMAAGTYVVRSARRCACTPPPLMPPPLAEWAGTADIAALPAGLALAVRQFLGRAPDPDAGGPRVAGGRAAAAGSCRTCRHRRRPAIHPEYVLAAVVAERRRRDAERLGREEQRRAQLLPADPLAA